MFSLFKNPQVVDVVTAANLTTTFEWVVQNFDHSYFSDSTVLVRPTRECFPDRATSELEMAQVLCKRILSYAGLSRWPFSLVAPQNFSAKQPPILKIATDKRYLQDDQCTSDGEVPMGYSRDTYAATYTEFVKPELEVSYASAMMKQPMDLVGSMSKNIAQHYLFQSQLVPPAGQESFDATSEVIAIFMGFGIMIANSAYTFRGSCAKCYDPRAVRPAALSEDEAIYTLALFCHYKNIDNKQVTPSLKGHLRGAFKKARKQIIREQG